MTSTLYIKDRSCPIAYPEQHFPREMVDVVDLIYYALDESFSATLKLRGLKNVRERSNKR